MNEDSKASDFIQNEEQPINNIEHENVTFSGQKSIFDILRTKTGTGSIDSYIDSPLNFNKSEGLAQILRGFTGFLGALDYAILDIILGGLKFYKGFNEPSKVVEEVVSHVSI
jgi:hypothetical protein